MKLTLDALSWYRGFRGRIQGQTKSDPEVVVLIVCAVIGQSGTSGRTLADIVILRVDIRFLIGVFRTSV